MASQQPPRPWFRLATMMRPAAPAPTPAPAPAPAPAPTTVLQPTPPLPPFRPPTALPQPSTQPPEPPRPLTPAVVSPPPRPLQGTAPPSPVQAPAELNLPVASPPSGSRSPVAASPIPRSPVAAFPAARSPVAPAGVRTPAASPPATTAPPPQAERSKPGSPIVSAPSISDTRQVVPPSNFPPSPKTNASATPSPALPTSPAPKTLLSSPAPPPPSPARLPAPSIATVTAPPPPSPAKPTSTIPSPKVVKQWDRKTPPDQAPVLKNLSAPPSPLTLPPPAQLKPSDSDYMEPIPAVAEQKTVLMQDTSNEKPKLMALSTSNNGHLQNNKHGQVKKDAKGVLSKKSSASSSEEQLGMRIITLAGENKGAVMELSSPSRRKLSSTYNNNNKGQKINGSRGTDDDARLKTKEGESAKNGMMKQQQPMDAFVNSNVQGVNNSILYDCAYTHRDPGVHLSVSRNGNAARRAHPLGDASLHHH